MRSDGTFPSSPSMPEGFFKIKDDNCYACGYSGECKNRLHFHAFNYKANPDEDLVYYLSNKGFHGLDFSIERI